MVSPSTEPGGNVPVVPTMRPKTAWWGKMVSMLNTPTMAAVPPPKRFNMSSVNMIALPCVMPLNCPFSTALIIRRWSSP
ncbi:hypothetical protein D3C81_1938850 [compost metagenome]